MFSNKKNSIRYDITIDEAKRQAEIAYQENPNLSEKELRTKLMRLLRDWPLDFIQVIINFYKDL
jgi:replicative DNA helicase